MIAANCSKWYFVAVNIREDNTDTMYFTETDHLAPAVFRGYPPHPRHPCAILLSAVIRRIRVIRVLFISHPPHPRHPCSIQVRPTVNCI
jgi:hypothetical protein